MNYVKYFFFSIIFSSSISVAFASPYLDPTQVNTGYFIGVNDNYIGGHFGSINASYLSNNFGTYYGYSALRTSNAGDDISNFSSVEIDKDILTTGIFLYLSQPPPKPNGGIYLDKNLFIFITGHGRNLASTNTSQVWIDTGDDGTKYLLNDYDLASSLSRFPEINKWVIIDSCNSGGFIDDLSALPNISIITSASSTSLSKYDIVSGKTIFGMELSRFFEDQSGDRFSFQELQRFLKYNPNLFSYIGMRTYNNDFDGPGAPSYFTYADWDIQTYQSPLYTPVPEPSTFVLLGAGLAGLAVWRRKRS